MITEKPKYVAEIVGPRITDLLGLNSLSQRLITDVMLSIKDEQNKYAFIEELRKLLRAPLLEERTFVDFCILFRKYSISELTADEWAIIQNKFVQKLIKQRNIVAIAALVASILAGTAFFTNNNKSATPRAQPTKILENK